MDDVGLDAQSFAELAASLHSAPTPVQTAEQAVAYARQQLDADHAGITLIRSRNRLQTIAPTDELVEQLDRLQYDLAQGPCRDSSWHGDTLLAPDVATDPRWPAWGPEAAGLGVASTLAVELTDSAGIRIGAVNLYWREPRSFDRDDVAFAHVFARHAALAVATSLQGEPERRPRRAQTHRTGPGHPDGTLRPRRGPRVRGPAVLLPAPQPETP